MSASSRSVRFLLDEHYPGRLAENLLAGGIDAVAGVSRDDLQGRDDTTVIRTARDETRIVVTEDVTTFSIAMAAVPDHMGVIFCHHARFPRTRAGLASLEAALVGFADAPPPGMIGTPFTWWLAAG